MSIVRIGHFTGDGGDVYLPLGFIPDYFKMFALNQTNPNIYEWFEESEDSESTTYQEGSILTGSSGEVTMSAEGAGIVAYNTGSQSPTINEYADVGSPTARSATAPGTYVRGSTSGTNNLGQDVDREAIFECVASTGAVATEPTWPTAIGGQVTDDSSNTWERVNEPLKRGGYQGIKIDETIQTNSINYYYMAIKADAVVNHGDVDGWTGGIDQNWV